LGRPDQPALQGFDGGLLIVGADHAAGQGNKTLGLKLDAV